MRCVSLKITVFIILSLNLSPLLQADELIMATGEHFTSSEIWEEGDKIRFNMQGIVVSVDKKDVVKIIRSAPIVKKQPVQPTPMVAQPMDLQPTRPVPQSPVAVPSEPGLGESVKNRQEHPLQRPNRRRPTHTNNIGLANVAWRMSPKEIAGMQKIETDPAFGGIDQYYIPEQPMIFAGAPIDGLVYGFWKNQLYSIMIWTEGRIGYRKLKHGIISAYGRGIQRRLDMERHVWDEPLTQRMLEFDEERKMGLFVMRSAELDDIIKQHYPASPQGR